MISAHLIETIITTLPQHHRCSTRRNLPTYSSSSCWSGLRKDQPCRRLSTTPHTRIGPHIWGSRTVSNLALVILCRLCTYKLSWTTEMTFVTLLLNLFGNSTDSFTTSTLCTKVDDRRSANTEAASAENDYSFWFWNQYH